MSDRPPDRSTVPTEGLHPDAARVDLVSTEALVALMSAEDARAVEAVRAEAAKIAAFVDALAERFVRGGRLVYVGAGTSGRLGVLDASECPPTFLVEPGRVVGVIAGGDGALRTSSETLEDVRDGANAALDALALTDLDTVVGITAGGTTPYPLGAIEHAHALGCLTALLTCADVPDGFLADHVLNPRTGPELVAGSTRLKAGTATKLVLNMISTALMVRLGKVHGGLMVDVSATNDKLRDRAARIVSTLTGLSRDDAFALLDGAGGRVKTAVVMHAMGASRSDAEAMLALHSGSLRGALGSEP